MVTSFQQFHELCMKNKLLEPCNVSLVTFLLEHDPQSFEDIMKLGDIFFATHLTTKLQKETHFMHFQEMQLVWILLMRKRRLMLHKNLVKKNSNKEGLGKEV